MNDELSAIFMPFKKIVFFCFAEVLVLFCIMTMYQGSYNKTIKLVKLNGANVYLYATERYRNYILPIWTTSEVNTYGTGEHDYDRNEINSLSNIKLTVDEYEEYYNGIRINHNLPNDISDKNIDYKKVERSQMRLKISRKNKTIYDGQFIEDITDYIASKGRYFIHIYLTRKDNFYSIVQTDISFNVVVDGGNYE